MIEHPIVTLTLQPVLQQRIDALSQAIQKLRPVTPPKTARALLRPLDVRHLDKGIVHFLEGDLLALKLAGQPFVAIEVNLHRERTPSLHFHVHEAELTVHEVVVQHQAAAQVRFHHRTAVTVTDSERAARFHRRIDAHQPFLEVILVGHGAGVLLHLLSRRQVLERPAGALGHAFGVFLQPLGEVRPHLLEALPARRQLLQIQRDLLGIKPGREVAHAGHR